MAKARSARSGSASGGRRRRRRSAPAEDQAATPASEPEEAPAAEEEEVFDDDADLGDGDFSFPDEDPEAGTPEEETPEDEAEGGFDDDPPEEEVEGEEEVEEEEPAGELDDDSTPDRGVSDSTFDLDDDDAPAAEATDDLGGDGGGAPLDDDGEDESWYQEDFKGIKGVPTSADRTARFWLRREESTKVVFLSDGPLEIWEHEIRYGKQRFHFTCRGSMRGGCPLCQAGDQPYYVALWSCIHLAKFTRKDGTVIKNPRRVIAAKQMMARILQQKREQRGNLRGTVWLVTRSSNNKSPNMGDQWEFEGRMTSTQAAKIRDDRGNQVSTGAIDLKAECKPLPRERLVEMARRACAGGGSAGDFYEPETSDDDAPF